MPLCIHRIFLHSSSDHLSYTITPSFPRERVNVKLAKAQYKRLLTPSSGLINVMFFIFRPLFVSVGATIFRRILQIHTETTITML
jgi:hypothetical protein